MTSGYLGIAAVILTVWFVFFRKKKHRVKKNGKLFGPVMFVVILTALAGAGKTITHHGGKPGPIPDGNAYTPASWAKALLTAGGWSRNTCNTRAVETWETTEGGHWANNASYNPLNTTWDDSGRWETEGLVTGTINSDGVRAYNSWSTGFKATLDTLNLGNYADIRSALSRADDAQAVADAVVADRWGTGLFNVSC